MKFLDRLKLATHNMWTSKSRTILTILIVFIVSLLIQVVGIACINFATNLNGFMEKDLKESGSTYSARYVPAPGQMFNNRNAPTIGVDMIDRVYNILKDDPTATAISYRANYANVSFGRNSSSMAAYDFRSTATSINFVEGRSWNISDYDTNALFLEKEALSAYNLAGGYNYTVGDKLMLAVNFQSNDGEYNESLNEYVIKGVFTSDSESFGYNAPTIIFDATYITKYAKVTYSTIEINNPKINTDNTLSTIMLFNKTLKNLNSLFTADANGSFKASNSFIDNSMMVIYMDIAIIGVGVVIGFIVLLLSIGSIANTMIISIDKNKKFTGLMMAMGLKPKNIKSVIRLEGAMTIIFGVLLSTIICLAFIPVFTSVLTNLFTMLMYDSTAVFKFTFPFYFPIAVSVVFILMAMLFTKAGVSGLIKQDPITVISEVG